MKTVFLYSLLTCAFVHCTDLYLGNPSLDNLVPIYHKQARYRAIPFIRREKDIFYNDPKHRIFAKIVIVDTIPNSKSIATVTAGGIGQSYVNIRLTSERGVGLLYDISIYSNSETPVTTETTSTTDTPGNDFYRNLSHYDN